MMVTPVEDMNVVDWCLGPESEVLNSELKEKLEEAIGQLPEDLRTAAVLRDMQQLSTEEAADIVDISVSGFKARLRRGRALVSWPAPVAN
jgi:RNA polymerase sigma-70 factor (ECF subfamily)